MGVQYSIVYTSDSNSNSNSNRNSDSDSDSTSTSNIRPTSLQTEICMIFCIDSYIFLIFQHSLAPFRILT